MIVFRGRDIGAYGAWENRVRPRRISEFAGGGLKSTPSDIAQSHCWQANCFRIRKLEHSAIPRMGFRIRGQGKCRACKRIVPKLLLRSVRISSFMACAVVEFDLLASLANAR
jgi:hypothetical protein